MKIIHTIFFSIYDADQKGYLAMRKIKGGLKKFLIIETYYEKGRIRMCVVFISAYHAIYATSLTPIACVHNRLREAECSGTFGFIKPEAPTS